uniref:Putative ovule protein n=1 Tax=Solanum chacoense TaxID=4108 RepID=A0A0V0GQZ6_SOLCH
MDELSDDSLTYLDFRHSERSYVNHHIITTLHVYHHSVSCKGNYIIMQFNFFFFSAKRSVLGITSGEILREPILFSVNS